MTAREQHVKGIFKTALQDARRAGTIAPRHPAEVTSDRLLDAVTKWGGKFTGQELDMIAQIRHALEEIAEGDR